MLRSRVIPFLLVHNKGLVKTVGFKDSKYVGDPLNAVRIFNEKEVDELVVLDIDATRLGGEPNYELIKNLAAECRMPLCYGGGVTSADQVKKIIGLGVEKVSIGAAAVTNPDVVREAASIVGNQSVVVVIDVKRKRFSGKYEVFIRNGQESTGLSPVDHAKNMQALGAGEIVINSIDRDGTGKGYDVKLIEQIRNVVSVPITAIGGAGTHEDVESLINQFQIIGAGAGSLFVFKGKYRAVLINYPKQPDKDRIVGIH